VGGGAIGGAELPTALIEGRIAAGLAWRAARPWATRPLRFLP